MFRDQVVWRLVLWGTVVAGCGVAQAQATLQGSVRLESDDGPPVSGVAVSATGAAVGAVSGDDGAFALRFAAARPGQVVSVRVTDPDWVVINGEWLDLRLPDARSAASTALNLLVARPARRWEARHAYFRRASSALIEESYRQRLDELQARPSRSGQDPADPLRARQRLEREREHALVLSEDWLRPLGDAPADDGGAIFREALRLFVRQQPGEALRLLSDDRLQSEASETPAQVQHNVRAWQLKAQLLVTALQFDAAGKAHDRVVALAPASSTAWFGHALYAQRRGDLDAARRGHERALVLARASGRGAEVAHVTDQLAQLDLAQGRRAEATKGFEAALQLYRHLARTQSTTHLLDVARVLIALGQLRRDDRRLSDARAYLEEALALDRDRTRAASVVLDPDTAVTLSLLGLLERADGRYDAARRRFEEALQLYRPLAVWKPDLYLRRLAGTLADLGMLNRADNRLAEARQQLEESLRIARDLGERMPEAYRPDLAMVLGELGKLSRFEGRLADARKQQEEVVRIFRGLAQADPAMHRPNLAVALNSLGALSGTEKRWPEARKQFEEALALYRQAAALQPGTYVQEVQMVEGNLRLLPR